MLDPFYGSEEYVRLKNTCLNVLTPYMTVKQADNVFTAVIDAFPVDQSGRFDPHDTTYVFDRCGFVAYLVKAGVKLHLEEISLDKMFGVSDWAEDIHGSQDTLSPLFDDKKETDVNVLDMNLQTNWPAEFWKHRVNQGACDDEAFIIDVPQFANKEHNFIVIEGHFEDFRDNFIRHIIRDILGYGSYGLMYQVLGYLEKEGTTVTCKLNADGRNIFHSL